MLWKMLITPLLAAAAAAAAIHRFVGGGKASISFVSIKERVRERDGNVWSILDWRKLTPERPPPNDRG